MTELSNEELWAKRMRNLARRKRISESFSIDCMLSEDRKFVFLTDKHDGMLLYQYPIEQFLDVPEPDWDPCSEAKASSTGDDV